MLIVCSYGYLAMFRGVVFSAAGVVSGCGATQFATVQTVCVLPEVLRVRIPDIANTTGRPWRRL